MKLGVSYIASFLPDHIQTDMMELARMGADEVLFALQENHLEILTGALTDGARLALDQGLEPHAVIWGFANTFGGGRMSNFLLREPDAMRVDREGRLVPMACLNNPLVAAEFVRCAEIIVARGFRGIFIDEPTVQDCCCEHCRKKFDRLFHRDLPSAPEDPELRRFQRICVEDYTKSLCKMVKKTGGGLKTTTCLMPVDRENFAHVAAIGELDVFGTDPYWLIDPTMTLEEALETAAEAKKEADKNGKESQIWLICSYVKAGLEEEIYRGGKKLAALGFDSLYTWSFHGGAGTTEACEDPRRAWANVVKLYRELSGR